MSRSDDLEPASPCIGVCRLNPVSRLCEGCLRHVDEIADWWDLAAHEKRWILEQLDARRDCAFADLWD